MPQAPPPGTERRRALMPPVPAAIDVYVNVI